MTADNLALAKSLITAAAKLQAWADNPPYKIQGQPIVPLTAASSGDLAQLLEKAADALIKGAKP